MGEVKDGSENDVDVPGDRRLGLQTGGERILMGLQERPLTQVDERSCAAAG